MNTTNNNNNFITPQWDTPDCVKSLVTTRLGGVSKTPYSSFNLASHVGDNILDVNQNRHILNKHCPTPAIWLKQTHSKIITNYIDYQKDNIADGIFSQQSNQICSVLTADCLPLLISSQCGAIVAAVHAGWKGLADGIIDKTIQKLCAFNKISSNNLLVWLGPAISQQHFEVGDEVRQCFINNSTENSHAFIKNDNRKYMADIYQLARNNLYQLGIEKIYGGNFCTYSDSKRFYSYRREGITGRMASMIWIEK